MAPNRTESHASRSGGHSSRSKTRSNSISNLTFPGSVHSVDLSFLQNYPPPRPNPTPNPTLPGSSHSVNMDSSKNYPPPHPNPTPNLALPGSIHSVDSSFLKSYPSPPPQQIKKEVNHTPDSKVKTKHEPMFTPYSQCSRVSPNVKREQTPLFHTPSRSSPAPSTSSRQVWQEFSPTSSRSQIVKSRSEHLPAPKVHTSVANSSYDITWKIAFIEPALPRIHANSCTKPPQECVVRCGVATSLQWGDRNKRGMALRRDASWYSNTPPPADCLAYIPFEDRRKRKGRSTHGLSVQRSLCFEEVVKNGEHAVPPAAGQGPMTFLVEVPGFGTTSLHAIPIQCDHGRMTMSGLFFGLGLILADFVKDTPRTQGFFTSVQHVYIKSVYMTAERPNIWSIELGAYY
ncbi:hypothetical protein Moror_6107 [Moniliophthora roreri MCA 2997]|uniref:Uncharacterized protein n=1 Tax=Moniliophthora roreri (strain MCA 2997) TaxID=1381753 RepID=V2WCJ9_MONRO|nr:hypothetical protein Moror_6107 [Moniliophthora roreri MCA 2997]